MACNLNYMRRRMQLGAQPHKAKASGAVATFRTNLAAKLDSLFVDVTPVQDLHGQAYPYPPGGGANLLDLDKASFNPSAYGFTITRDGDGVKIAGTATQTGNLSFNLIINYSGETLGGKGYVLQVFDVTSGYTVGGVWGFRTESEKAFAIRLDGITQGQNVNVSMKLSVAATSQTSWSPYSNICPITGWTGANVYRTGVNVWDEETQDGYWNSTTGKYIYYAGQLCSKNYISVKQNTTYRNYKEAVTNQGELIFFDADKGFIFSKPPSAWINKEFTTPDNCYFIQFNLGGSYGTTYNHDISINYPATDTAYHAYTGQTYPISWQDEAGTVYGGTLEPLTGVLTVDRASTTVNSNALTNNGSDGDAYKVFYRVDGRAFTLNVKSNIFIQDNTKLNYMVVRTNSNGIEFSVQNSLIGVAKLDDDNTVKLPAAKTWFTNNPVQLVYELATPITYQLDPIEVKTLIGQNNLWADCGNVDLSYWTNV